ncbi:ZCHC3 protein, partial [Atractosteus spatula]|nr:ZCHC3 protein [Atractosteus spatula]
MPDSTGRQQRNVHMFDPFVTDQDVTTFLRRYVEVRKGPGTISDTRTVWTGKRRYEVELRRDLRTPDGFTHPPGNFSIGSGRGYLYYWNQPEFCRKCQGFGHREGTCTVGEFGKCHRRGHSTRECPVKECSLYGNTGHLYWQCNQRGRDLVREIKAWVQRPEEEDQPEGSRANRKGGKQPKKRQEEEGRQEGRQVGEEEARPGTSWEVRNPSWADVVKGRQPPVVEATPAASGLVEEEGGATTLTPLGKKLQKRARDGKRQKEKKKTSEGGDEGETQEEVTGPEKMEEEVLQLASSDSA